MIAMLPMAISPQRRARDERDLASIRDLIKADRGA